MRGTRHRTLIAACIVVVTALVCLFACTVQLSMPAPERPSIVSGPLKSLPAMRHATASRPLESLPAMPHATVSGPLASLPAMPRGAREQLPLQTSDREEPPISLQARLSHSAFTKTVPRRLALRIDLGAVAGRSSTQRRPLNLALVIDRSASMADEGKFDYAMQAARLVIENLTERDIVSIVAFNQEAVVLSPAGSAVNNKFLDHRLDEIAPEGWTNLSAGLLEAFAQLERSGHDDETMRVIVLTDGKANRGITDPNALRRLAGSARSRGIVVSTMGCGADFDERVLIAMAEAGGGRYTYVQSTEQIPEAMAAELDGLLHVVAQNVRVDVVAKRGLEITAVSGRLLNAPTCSYTFDLGDFREGERGVLLVYLEPRDFVTGTVATIDCTLSFDRADLAVRERHSSRLEAVMTHDANLVRNRADRTVVLYATILDASERAEDAVLGFDEEGYHEAVDLFRKYYELTRQHAREIRDQQLLNQTFLLNHFMAELSEAAEHGFMHGHADAKRRLSKEVEFRRYLRSHHRHGH